MTATREHLPGLELALDQVGEIHTGEAYEIIYRLYKEAQSAPEPVQGEACPGCESQNVIHLMHCKDCETDYAGADQVNRNAAISRANMAAAKPVAELVELLRDARSDLAAYIDEAYPQFMLEYPHNQRKHAADMEIVHRIDAKLAELQP